MERYVLKNNVLVSPPDCGVTAKGEVVSNFANRVRNDAVFAAENGYYPLCVKEPDKELLEEGECVGEGTYILVDGYWVFQEK